MEFLEFTERHKIGLDPGINSLCLDALDIMENSNDPLHNHAHIKDILDGLDELTRHEKRMIDYDVLLPAICWHDTWHAKQPATCNSIIIFYRFFVEGLGSAALFERSAKKYPIKKDVSRKIKIAIMQHVRTGCKVIDNILFAPSQLETKILKDLDELDTWSLKRLKSLKIRFLRDKLHTGNLWIIKWYFKDIMLESTPRLFYLDYSKEEFKRRKKAVVDWAIKNYEMVRKDPGRYFREEYKGTFFDATPDDLKKELYAKL